MTASDLYHRPKGDGIKKGILEVYFSVLFGSKCRSI